MGHHNVLFHLDIEIVLGRYRQSYDLVGKHDIVMKVQREMHKQLTY